MTSTPAQSPASISEIVHRPPAELKPWPTNPRVHPPKQRFKLKNSMFKFGFTVPVLVDEQSFILSGHCRVDVAQELGLPTIPTRMVVGWTRAQKRAYVIADNKLALLAEWDLPLLKSELEFLSEQVIDIEDTAFSTAEIDLMFEEHGAVDSVKQHGRLNDIHRGRLDGDECRCLVSHGCGSCGWLSLSLDD